MTPRAHEVAAGVRGASSIDVSAVSPTRLPSAVASPEVRRTRARRRVRIAPSSGWASVQLAELLEFRDLVFFLAWRDIKVRYKQTLLGAAWAVLQPLMT